MSKSAAAQFPAWGIEIEPGKLLKRTDDRGIPFVWRLRKEAVAYRKKIGIGLPPRSRIVKLKITVEPA